MSWEIGDVVIWDQNWPGHVGMIYDEADGRRSAKIIHARLKTGFAIEYAVTDDAITVDLLEGAKIYKPPWKHCVDKKWKQAQLKSIADELRRSATYGAYRAVRLYVGSSHYGSQARSRLDKYRQRMSDPGVGKFITTITCSEAIILCYQLTFTEGEYPFFIQLDAAHSMPHSLGQWLTPRWGHPEIGR